MSEPIIPFQPKPLPKKQTEPEKITLANYNEMALQHAKKSGVTEFPTLTIGSPECAAWERYFSQHLGWQPWAFKALKSERIQAMTVPTQWPEWFDGTYAGVTE